MADTSVTTQQPNDPPPVLHTNGPVTVRTASCNESLEERRFIAQCAVDGFERKYIHATSKSKLPAMVTLYENHLSGRPPLFFERILVAECNGERAGVCVLRYKGDGELFPVRSGDLPPLGCCDICGLACVDLGTKAKIPAGKCYVDHICVSPRFRGKGVGKVLLETADMDARKRGCKSIFLLVATSNKAKHLYQRQGYMLKDTKSLCCGGCVTYCMTGEREFAIMEKDV